MPHDPCSALHLICRTLIIRIIDIGYIKTSGWSVPQIVFHKLQPCRLSRTDSRYIGIHWKFNEKCRFKQKKPVKQAQNKKAVMKLT
jgi:hypothetical protein